MAGKVALIQGCAYELGQKLGEGGFAVVHAARAPSGRKVAIKRVNVQEDDVERLELEVRLMAQFTHPTLLGSIASEVRKAGSGVRQGLIAMELAPGGHVVSLMNKRIREGARFSRSDVVRIMHDAASAVAALHAMDPPIAHRDIKAENMLVFEGNFRLCDFGSCSMYSFQCHTGSDISFVMDELQRCTTCAYRAPEQCDLMSKLRMDERVDVWALGVLLYTLLYFASPFPDDAPMAIAQGRYSIPDSSADPELVALMRELMTIDADSRPSAYSAVQQLSRMARRAVPEGLQPSGARQQQHPSLSSGPRRSSAAPRQGARPPQQKSRSPPPGGATGGCRGALMGMLDWSQHPAPGAPHTRAGAATPPAAWPEGSRQWGPAAAAARAPAAPGAAPGLGSAPSFAVPAECAPSFEVPADFSGAPAAAPPPPFAAAPPPAAQPAQGGGAELFPPPCDFGQAVAPGPSPPPQPGPTPPSGWSPSPYGSAASLGSPQSPQNAAAALHGSPPLQLQGALTSPPQHAAAGFAVAPGAPGAGGGFVPLPSSAPSFVPGGPPGSASPPGAQSPSPQGVEFASQQHAPSPVQTAPSFGVPADAFPAAPADFGAPPAAQSLQCPPRQGAASPQPCCAPSFEVPPGF